MLPSLYQCLLICLFSAVMCQRRRDRTRTSQLQPDTSSSSRALFEEPETSSSYETSSFFDWEDPNFGDFGAAPQWGFKKTRVRKKVSTDASSREPEIVPEDRDARGSFVNNYLTLADWDGGTD